MLFKVCVSLLIFCLVDLPIGVSGALKSPSIIVLLLISPFMLVSICLIYCGAPMLGAAAAAAKSLQLCLTLCNPIDGSLPDSSVHGIFQARVLELVAIAFSDVGGIYTYNCYIFLD